MPDFSTDSLSAIAALGALLIAAWAGNTAKRVHDIEHSRDVVSDAIRRQGAAARVAAWVVIHLQENHRQDGILVENRSQTPIFDVSLTSTDKNGKNEPVIKLNVVPPGSYFIGRTNQTYHWDFPEDRQFLTGRLRPIMKKPEWKVTELNFTDATGIRWRRDDHGRLHECTTPGL